MRYTHRSSQGVVVACWQAIALVIDRGWAAEAREYFYHVGV